MAFIHGSKAKVYMNGYDLSPYLRSYQEAGSIDTAETSTFGNLYKTYVPGLAGFTISSDGIYDGAANAVDDIMQQAISSTGDDLVMFLVQGESAGAPGYGAAVTSTSLQVSAEIGNVSSISYQGQGDSSIDRCLVQSVMAANGAAFSSASLDSTVVSTANGCVLYVQQTAAAAGVTYTLQDSADNSTWAAVASGSFALSSGNAAGRLVVPGTIRRYTRIQANNAATFGAYISRK